MKTRLRVVPDTQRKPLQKKVTEEEDKEEVTRPRHSNTTHYPPQTSTTRTTQTHHSHNHSRKRREAAKSDRNQAQSQRKPKAAARRAPQVRRTKQRRRQQQYKRKKQHFTVIQKSVRSLKTSDRVWEIQREVEVCKLDAILSSDTWRLSGVETRPHVYRCLIFLKRKNKHGVGILLNKRWRKTGPVERVHQRASCCYTDYSQ